MCIVTGLVGLAVRRPPQERKIRGSSPRAPGFFRDSLLSLGLVSLVLQLLSHIFYLSVEGDRGCHEIVASVSQGRIEVAGAYFIKRIALQVTSLTTFSGYY